jgi:hypothetical protein
MDLPLIRTGARHAGIGVPLLEPRLKIPSLPVAHNGVGIFLQLNHGNGFAAFGQDDVFARFICSFA